MDNLKITMPGKPEYFTMLRLAASALAAQAGFGLDDLDDIKVALTEACKSVSCHGCEAFSDRYEIEFNLAPQRMEITVIDACEAHTIKKNGCMCPFHPIEGDIGTIMIRSLMNCVEIGVDKAGHKYVNMVKKI